MRGISKVCRVCSLVDLAVKSTAASMPPGASMEEIVEDLIIDTGADHRGAMWGKTFPVQGTRARWYAAWLDRAIVGPEYFRCLGQGDLRIGDLSLNEIIDMSGDSMSMPSWAVIIVAAICAADLPGFWAAPCRLRPGS